MSYCSLWLVSGLIISFFHSVRQGRTSLGWLSPACHYVELPPSETPSDFLDSISTPLPMGQSVRTPPLLGSGWPPWLWQYAPGPALCSGFLYWLLAQLHSSNSQAHSSLVLPWLPTIWELGRMSAFLIPLGVSLKSSSYIFLLMWVTKVSPVNCGPDCC